MRERFTIEIGANIGGGDPYDRKWFTSRSRFIVDCHSIDGYTVHLLPQQ